MRHFVDEVRAQLERDAEKARATTQCKRRGTMSRLCMQLGEKLMPGEYAINGNSSCTGVEGKCGCPHAEQRLIVRLLRDRAASFEQMILLTTLEPCVQCANLIILSGIKRVAWLSPYSDSLGRVILANGGVRCIDVSSPFYNSTV